jgi:hypothetical protein
MSGIPPANNDILIPKLRNLSNLIYNPIFKTLPKIQEVITILSQNLNQFSGLNPDHKTAAILLDDINWLRETLDEDFQKLNKIENHIKFLNADETLTNQREIVGVFVEFGEFFQEMILGNLSEVLNGVSISISDDKLELKNCFKLNGFDLSEIINLFKKYKITIKILTDYFRNIELQKFNSTLSQNTLNQEEFNILEAKVVRVSKDLVKVSAELNNL